MNDLQELLETFLHNCNLKISINLKHHLRTTYNGTKYSTFWILDICDIISEKYKTLNNLNSFKESVKKWAPLNCPYKLCKTYVNNVDFLKG